MKIAGYETHPAADLFPLMDKDGLALLAEDIEKHGQREPVVLHEGKVLDGRNRLLACERIGCGPETEEWTGVGSPVEWVLSMNLHRRHLTESQRAMVGAAALDALKEEAKERQLSGLKQGDKSPVSANLPEREKGEAREKAAALVNVSPRSIANAAKVLEKGVAELQDAVRSDRVAVSTAAEIASEPIERQREIAAMPEAEILAAAKEIRQRRAKENEDKRAEVKARMVEPPPGKYRCIVIDPPWEMEKIERDSRPAQVGFEYPTMNEAELCAFPLPRFADDNCHLYLWTTHKHLPMAFRLAEAWGFKYQCLMTWVKNVGFTPFSWMYSTEHVLFCRKGSLQLDKLGMRLDFSAKVREHSRKPDEFYELVRKASPGPRIDVFSREKRDGFDQFGNEAGKF